ncbi:MAG: hypothetical protein QNJ23_10020 [Woeseiaceae bacterium]|nr:hypothetical protein [Woeseiaceae bacterium]
MSGFEIITITFSFVVGLGMAQVLRSVGFVVREHGPFRLHWIPFSVAGIVIFFQVQFWFGLTVVNSLMDHWSWPVYGLMLLLAMVIFLAAATVLPPPNKVGERDLIEDFSDRGRISLLFIAVYLVGWIVVAIVFWRPAFWQLVVVNGVWSTIALVAYLVKNVRQRDALHLVLIILTIAGAQTVWTTPNLQMPMQ